MNEKLIRTVENIILIKIVKIQLWKILFNYVIFVYTKSSRHSGVLITYCSFEYYLYVSFMLLPCEIYTNFWLYNGFLFPFITSCVNPIVLEVAETDDRNRFTIECLVAGIQVITINFIFMVSTFESR